MKKRPYALVLGLSIAAIMVLCLIGISYGAQPGAALAAQAAAKAAAPPRGKPTFSATFPRGSKLNVKQWATCYYGANPKIGCTNFGNSQDHEWYLRGQVRVYDGVLHLVAQRKATRGTNATGRKKREYYCRSGMIASYPSLRFKYGFLQIVAKIPHRAGLWPGLWLAAANHKWPPEIDMLESWGVSAEAAVFFHPRPSSAYLRSRDRAVVPVNWTTSWQKYSIRWTRSKLIYYVGKNVVMTVRKNVPRQPMFFLADVAEYLPATPGTCNGQMQIRSVKYWKRA